MTPPLSAEAVSFAIWTCFAVTVGAVLGSFINVVAARLPRGESVVTPRSRCPECGAQIAWYDNVPVLSYFVLRARCRRCRAPISWQYPAVEACAALFALGLWLTRGPSLALLFDAAVVGLLLTLAVIDARTYLLPERLTIPLALIALAGRAVVPLAQPPIDLALAGRQLLDGLGGAGLGVLLLGSVALIGTRWARRSGRIGPDEDAMGFGDIALIAGIGAQVGTLPVLAVIFLASTQGAVIGGLLLLLGGDAASAEEPAEPEEWEEDWSPPHHAIPFGPFLALGAVEWILFGPLLSRWFGGPLAWF